MTTWNAAAATFDDQPDHGLADATVRAAWADLLLPLMPQRPSSIIDVGCGTGSLSVLLAESGHDVRAFDFAERMLHEARRKAAEARVDVEFRQGDATDPPFSDATCDVVLCRHILWAMPEPSDAIERWLKLLRPGGVLLLIEGRWSTGTGYTARHCQSLLAMLGREAAVTPLRDPTLWGGPITDERYLLVSQS